MKYYVIQYMQTTPENNQTLYWHCSADNEEHAIEQLKNEVEHAQGNNIISFNVIKTDITT